MINVTIATAHNAHLNKELPANSFHNMSSAAA